ncbi:MAG: molybdopterin molybdotransferase MoeA [Vulcanimicrobiaceae bacterium]
MIAHAAPAAIPYEDAQARAIAVCAPVGVDEVGLDAAAGRVVARSIWASDDLVPFARSAMDGFAVRAADTIDAPRTLAVRGSVFAERGAFVHQPQTATAIATGGPIPHGADAVVPIEDVVVDGAVIRITRPVAPLTHVFSPGEDARRGELLIAAGAVLSAARLGLLAAAGCARVAVFARPRVAVVTTGDEIVPVGTAPAHGQIRNSNAVVLAGILAAWGGRIIAVRHAHDDSDGLRALLDELAGGCDLVVTTGGASVGVRDYAKPVLRDLGFAFAFESVALRPAKPTAFATRADARVAVLPGNPASALVGLHEVIRPAFMRLAGRSELRAPRVRAALASPVRAKPGKAFAAFAALELRDARLIARVLGNQCSALTRTAADAAGLIIVPPGDEHYAPGEHVDVDVTEWNHVESA